MSVPLYRDEEMPVVTLAPNWNTATPALTVREDTSILEALDQSEERWQHYPRPLYGIRFEATAANSRQQGFFRKMFERAEAKPFGVPLWTEQVELTEEVAADATSLVVSSMDGTLFTVFDYLILWLDPDTFEVLRYDDITFIDSIPLIQATTRAWPAGTKVVPVAFGYCKRPDFGSLGADNSHIPIDFEERILFGSDREGDYWAPITPEVDYTPCYDEIVVSWGSLPTTVLNIEISHAATADGPWLWWGETRQRTNGVTLSNYFKNRWVRIRALTEEGAIVLKTFQPTPPAVDPPIVEIFQREPGADKSTRAACGVANKPEDYTGAKPTATFSTFPLPYGDGYSGVDIYEEGELVADTARDRIAAVYPGNLIDPASETRMFHVELFSQAFVQLEWRYAPDTTWTRSARFGKDIDVVATSEQDGVTIKWTLDGTDPTESNGFASDSTLYPYPNIFVHTPFVPYVIARCFKDGCKSPPVYVPIDLTYHADPWCNPRQGHGGTRATCPHWYRDHDCVKYPEEGTGIWSLEAGCADYDLGELRAATILEAASGMLDMYPTQVLREFLGETIPRFTCSSSEGETCYGPDLNLCDGVSYWGGGSFRMDCDLHCVNIFRDDSFGWNYDSDTFSDCPDNAFYLMGATISSTIEGVPTALTLPPFPSQPREQVEGLSMSSSTTEFTNKMKSLFLNYYVDAFLMPVDGQKDELDDTRVTLTCAAY